ncbi:DUF3501 family protein [Aquibaculum arenosum]|uniref:DUF3501 family protein n=1 Tax=Aquibaculum arenosum TaxID=3032591 RepID=A0ABT5YHZ3_9PROT|nr:DUF3501 family protein [Fodinicurvata sp. CAU 1616]MDF2094561.1 DUF3501 family protein [Fodinicurvata sp. CAU 1616]
MTKKTEITRDDIWPMERYEAERKGLRKQLVEQKRNRRCEVGPVCTFYFESYETMWAQIHEMLYIEKGGEEQIADELSAYNPLIPKGNELCATVMFEIDDPVRRKAFLSRLGGVEETAFFEFDGHRVLGKPEEDVDRTTADGKASSVQFIHFTFTPEQIEAFKTPETRVILGFSHPQYSHMVVLNEATREALAGDFA